MCTLRLVHNDNHCFDYLCSRVHINPHPPQRRSRHLFLVLPRFPSPIAVPPRLTPPNTPRMLRQAEDVTLPIRFLSLILLIFFILSIVFEVVRAPVPVGT